MKTPILRKYATLLTTAKAIPFSLLTVDGVDFITGATFAAGDIQISIDGGAYVDTANLPVAEGNSYRLILTVAELTGRRIRLSIVDQTGTKFWLDTDVIIETFGNAAAMYAFDFDTASVAQTGDSYARIGVNGAGLTSLATSTNLATLLTRLTAARAGNLDELAAANIPTDIDTLLSRLTSARAAALSDLIDAGRLDTIFDSILENVAGLSGAAMRGTDNANTTTPDNVTIGAIANYVDTLEAANITINNFVDTLETVIGTPSGASLSDDVAVVQQLAAAVKLVTDELPNSGALTSIAQAANLATAQAILRKLEQGIIIGAAVAGTLSATQATTDLTGYTDGQLIGAVIVWTSGVCNGERTDITANTAAGLLTYTAMTLAPSNGDTFKII